MLRAVIGTAKDQQEQIMINQAQPQDGVIELGAASGATRGYAGGPFEGWLIPDMQDDPH